MAICRYCNEEMKLGHGCTYPFVELGGKLYKRLGGVPYDSTIKVCGDCAIKNKPHNLHHIGCDQEECPKCGGQLISCDCKGKKFCM